MQIMKERGSRINRLTEEKEASKKIQKPSKETKHLLENEKALR